MKQFVKDFKEFALKGSILDLAVGVVIGGAFNQIVNSLVNDIIMPLVSRILNTSEIAKMSLSLGNSADGKEVLMTYGNFIQHISSFLIIALSVFVALRVIMKFKRKSQEAEEASPAKSEEVVLLEDIRDLLSEKK